MNQSVFLLYPRFLFNSGVLVVMLLGPVMGLPSSSPWACARACPAALPGPVLGPSVVRAASRFKPTSCSSLPSSSPPSSSDRTPPSLRAHPLQRAFEHRPDQCHISHRHHRHHHHQPSSSSSSSIRCMSVHKQTCQQQMRDVCRSTACSIMSVPDLMMFDV